MAYDRNQRHKFLSHVLRNFIEDRVGVSVVECDTRFLSHVLRNFIEEENNDEIR